MAPIIPTPTDIPENNTMGDEENNAIDIVSDSDSLSDEENLGYDGYEPLSQDPENYIINQNDDNNCLVEDDSQAVEGNILSNYSLLLPAPVSVEIEVNQPPEDIKMDEERIETIKSVMKNVTLPSSNMPQWANTVPEDEWKNALFSEILLKRANKDSGNRNANNFSSCDKLATVQKDIPR